MGMDVYGRSNEKAYFRNNWWWWRPLWEYCNQVAPDLVGGLNGHSNDGDGLQTQEECSELAWRLRAAVDAKMPYRKPEALAREDEQGEMYPFDYDNVLKFCEFLDTCGGFRMC